MEDKSKVSKSQMKKTLKNLTSEREILGKKVDETIKELLNGVATIGALNVHIQSLNEMIGDNKDKKEEEKKVN